MNFDLTKEMAREIQGHRMNNTSVAVSDIPTRDMDYMFVPLELMGEQKDPREILTIPRSWLLPEDKVGCMK